MNTLLKRSFILIFTLLTFSSFAHNDNTPLKETINLAEAEVIAININLAEADALMTLKGVGKKKAQAIVNYREENGAFTHIDDLLNVSGIGKKVLQANKDRLKI